MTTKLSGILNLNKPPGITSRKVVDVVQRLVQTVEGDTPIFSAKKSGQSPRAKVGHAGTLDPLADGVLVVCVGQATRLIEYIQRMPKTYVGTFLFGRRSDTEDIEGRIEELSHPPVPTQDQIEAAVVNLTGEILQRPPAYSALKVAGRRAYELARQGKEVVLPSRPVTVHRLEVRSYAYPELVLEIECSRGTYARSLGRDLAASLGTAAVMSALTRTAIGNFQLADALPPERLNADNIASHLLPLLIAVADLPRRTLSPTEAKSLFQGKKIARQEHTPIHSEIAALDTHGRLTAILQTADEKSLRPKMTFPGSLSSK